MIAPPSAITRPPTEIFGRHTGYGFAGLGVSTAIGNFTQTAIDLSFPAGLLGLLDFMLVRRDARNRTPEGLNARATHAQHPAVRLRPRTARGPMLPAETGDCDA